jgi:hypothetical protein
MVWGFYSQIFSINSRPAEVLFVNRKFLSQASATPLISPLGSTINKLTTPGICYYQLRINTYGEIGVFCGCPCSLQFFIFYNSPIL